MKKTFEVSGAPSSGRKSGGEALIEELHVLLATDYAVYIKTQNYHWNVTGPLFHSLHALFEEHYQQLLAEIDSLAERIRTLGHSVPASFSVFKSRSLVEEEEGTPAAPQMLKNLVSDHQRFIEKAKELIPLFDNEGDQATMDFLVEIVEAHEKMLWMLNSSI